ncbi:MAG: ABC transporter permease [Ekhidna sp.]|nr:ABC transporter permease [Ekhidna sp.]
MLKNFIITSFRTFTRNKTYFSLGLLGLSLGVSCVIALYAIINFQTNFDVHQADGENIYRIIGEYKIGDDEGLTPTVPHPLSGGLRDELPNLVGISNLYMLSEQVNIPLPKDKLKKIKQNKIGFVQEGVFDVLTFEWLAGDASDFDPSFVFLSETTARKFFSSNTNLEDLLGSTIILGNKHTLQLAGIYKDLPKKTDFPFEMLVSYEKQEGVNPYYGADRWGTLNGGTQCILKLSHGSDSYQAERSIQEAFAKHNIIEGYNLKLQSLAQIHIDPVGSYSGINFNKNYEILSYTIAFFLALIGAINFINLSTARAIKRAKEVGIRKVMGSQRFDLIIQFLLESMIIVSLSLLVGFFLANQILVGFEYLVGFSIELQDIPTQTWVVFSLVVIGGMTLMSGFYPAMVLSGFSPLAAIKTKVSNIDRQSRIPLRKILVGVQFGFSFILIIGAVVIFSQMRFMKNYDMGFKNHGIISLTFPQPDLEKQRRLQTMLESEPEFQKTSIHLGSPIARTNNTDRYFNPEQSKEDLVELNVKGVDEDYLNVFEIKLLAGRNLRSKDIKGNILLTKTATEKLHLGNPNEALGKTIEAKWGGTFKVVGVIDDFKSQSLNRSQTPVMLKYDEGDFYEIGISLTELGSQDLKTTVAKLEGIWDQVYPNLLIQYDFLDEQIKMQYQFHDIMAKATTFYVCVALLISMLGLYGLTDYLANSKRKEIGIRKVVGAEISQIIGIFLREILIILGTSLIVAGSASYWFMNMWLDGFEHRISLGWEIMLGSVGALLMIVFMTMGYRSYTAATINPVNVLMDE